VKEALANADLELAQKRPTGESAPSDERETLTDEERKSARDFHCQECSLGGKGLRIIERYEREEKARASEKNAVLQCVRLYVVLADIADATTDSVVIVPPEARLERVRAILRSVALGEMEAKANAPAVLHPDAVEAWREDARVHLLSTEREQRTLARRVIALADALDEEMGTNGFE